MTQTATHHVIKEILDECFTIFATHYKCTEEDVRQAYFNDIGSVKQDIRTLYANAYTALSAELALRGFGQPEALQGLEVSRNPSAFHVTRS